MAEKFIGIKQIFYGPVMDSAPESFAGVMALVRPSSGTSTFKEVKNVHQDTWGYEQAEPSFDDYVNELTGTNYYREMTERGAKTISFTMGEYDFQTKADLQGGTATETGWAAPDTLEEIRKSIVAITRTGNMIVFTNASITGRVDTQMKALGLGVAATAMENGNAGVKDEYWFRPVSA